MFFFFRIFFFQLHFFELVIELPMFIWVFIQMIGFAGFLPTQNEETNIPTSHRRAWTHGEATLLLDESTADAMEVGSGMPRSAVFPNRIIFFFFTTLWGTKISPTKAVLKMIFLFPRWDVLVSWSVFLHSFLFFDDTIIYYRWISLVYCGS